MVKKFPPPSNVIFDIGGGNGYVSQALIKNGLNAFLVEPGSNGIKNAKIRGLRNLICSRLEDAGFRQKSLPSIGLFDVIEHIEEDYKFLGLVRDLLVPAGKIYITVPTYKFLWSVDDATSGHFRRYRRNELVLQFENLGFNIDYFTYFFSILPLPIFMFRTIPSKFIKIKRKDYTENLHQHIIHPKFINDFLIKIWHIEQDRIKKQKYIPLGSSCIIVATIY